MLLRLGNVTIVYIQTHIHIHYMLILVGCCLATKSLNSSKVGGSRCGIGLLGVTSNKLVTFPRQNRIYLSGSQVHQKSGWALFQVFPHLTMNKRPCHVHSDSIPSKQIIGQAIL